MGVARARPFGQLILRTFGSNSSAMRFAILTLLVCCCGSSFAQTIDATITHNGGEREYILYVPEAYDAATPTPLLLNFHGYGSNAFEQMNYGDFRSIADTAGFLLVHPEGLPDVIGTAHWNVGWGFSGGIDDVGFVDALIDSLALDYNLDLNRVYSTGMSNGGYMSYHLACNLSDRIAAVASVTGAMTNTTLETCAATHVTPVLQIHGTADDVVTYDGGFFGIAISEVTSFWRNANNTFDDASVTPLEDVNPNDGSTVDHFVWDGGDCGSVVELYKIYEGGHTWPGAFIDISGTNYDFDGSTAVWNFLSQWSLEDLDCAVGVAEQTVAEVSVFPNPLEDVVRVEPVPFAGTACEVRDAQGRVVCTTSFDASGRLDASTWVPGVYVLQWEGQAVRVIKR